MFCALHDQLASLGRHAQLTRCFSAVAELLVVCTYVTAVGGLTYYSVYSVCLSVSSSAVTPHKAVASLK